MKEKFKEWMKIAIDDLEKAKILFDNKKYDGAIFFSQQSVEKAFKALILKRNGEIRKIHDLVILGRSLYLPEDLSEGIKELTLGYIYSRYPDVKKEKKLRERSSKFIKTAGEALNWVKINL